MTINEEVAMQAWGLEFEPQNLHFKKLGMVVCTCKSSTEEAVRVRCLDGSHTPAPGIHISRVWNVLDEVPPQVPPWGVASVQTPPLRKPT